MNERLYRFYDTRGVLLYVGITANLPRRLEKHGGREWWQDVARMECQPYPDRESVRAAEREAIETEKPLHNIRMNQAVLRPVAVAAATALIWRCAVCNEPIADKAGYVHVSNRDVNTHEEWRQQYEAERRELGSWVPIDLKALFEAPDRAKWVAHHRGCDPDPHSSDYWFGVERARTAVQLLDWSLHLSEKCWLEDTDWTSFIGAALAANHMRTDA